MLIFIKRKNMVKKENQIKTSEFKIFKSVKKYNYRPRDFERLKTILFFKSVDKDTNLNDIDVSNLTQIGGFGEIEFFKKRNFYVDEWDVSNVKNFNRCFNDCKKFNCDLSSWDVSNGTNFEFFLHNCQNFNTYVNNFDLRNAKRFGFFFAYCHNFNQEVYNFVFNDRVRNLNYFFYNAHSFNQDITMWDVSKINNFDYMFADCKSFLQDLSNWDVSKARTFENVFDGSLMEKYPELMPKKFGKKYFK